MINLRLSNNTVAGIKYLGGPRILTVDGILDQTQVSTNYVFDQILKSENLAGTIDYRGVYISNDYLANKTIYNLKLRIISQSPVANFSVGVITKNTDLEAIATEVTAPAGVTFYTKEDLDTTFDGYLDLSMQLLATEYVGIWFKREAINVGGTGTVIGDIVFEISYDA